MSDSSTTAPAPAEIPEDGAGAPAKRRRRWEDKKESVPADLPSAAPAINPALVSLAPALGLFAGTSTAVAANTPPQIDDAVAQAARDAMNRVSGMLMGSHASQASTTFQLDVDINDSTKKGQLTKKQTQEDITKATGATILIRGRYRPPGDTSTDERPLHLHVEARSQEALDEAEKMISDIMGPVLQPSTEITPDQPLSSPPPPQVYTPGAPIPQSRPSIPHSSAPSVHTCTLEVGVDAAAGYQVRGKLLGPKGSYLKHIQEQTGARVQLR